MTLRTESHLQSDLWVDRRGCQALAVAMRRGASVCPPAPTPDIKGLGGFRRWGWLSIRGHREQDSLSMGSQERRARHSHNVQLNAAVLCSRSKKKKKCACSFRRSARRIAAGADCFHAAGLITNVFQQAASELAGVRGAEQPRSF